LSDPPKKGVMFTPVMIEISKSWLRSNVKPLQSAEMVVS